MAYDCRPAGYAYRYTEQDGRPLRYCPGCINDLTNPEHGVEIEFILDVLDMDDDVIGNDHWTHMSNLDDQGNLLDVDGEVAAGFHSQTVCAECYENLASFEEVTEEQVGAGGIG